MTEADRVFSRFPSFIREYIYRHGWESLRQTQLDAARVILESDDHLLLSSSTASGKTEAAFFPILASLCDNPPAGGISVLYIAPLKSLINDQFSRMEELLSESGIPVCRWHGDVGATKKSNLLRHPEGILQITPESLESMVLNRKNDIPRLFSGLRFIVLDEVHTMIGSDRGSQVLCLITRICRLIARDVRRIGLSATVGDIDRAAAWLGAGSPRRVAAPVPPAEKLHWRLGMEHFYIQNENEAQSGEEGSAAGEENDPRHARARLDAGYEFLYDAVRDKKAIVFSNSREETEYVTATLRQIAERRGEPDVFLIHHGNLSAALREDAELRMKEDGVRAVTCATVTMELGIDIGRLERVAQIDAPTTVSGFLQRLGRSGRRGTPPEMIMLFREETPLPNAPLPQLIPFGLLRGIALVELYRRARFIEPPRSKRLPFSLAFHQTLSILASLGECTPRRLAEEVLGMPPFADMPPADYRELLVSMTENGYLELTEERGLIVGTEGERLLSSFRFYAVFEDSEDFTVRCDADEIGTITTPPPVGDRFALAGRVWEVSEVDLPRRLIYVKAVRGKMEISWPGDSGEIHTRVLEMMYDILTGDESYPYLMPNAAHRLETARRLARNTGVDRQMLVCLGGSSFCLFPWLGTRSFRTLRRYLARHAGELGISDIQSEGCCYITFKCRRQQGEELLSHLRAILLREGLDPARLVGEAEAPAYEKYDPLIPASLLRRAYAADRLYAPEVYYRLTEGIARGDGTTGRGATDTAARKEKLH